MKIHTKDAGNAVVPKIQPQQKHGLWENMKCSRACYVMMAPYFILFFLFTVLPVAASMVLSLCYFNVLQPPSFVGLRNYTQLFLEDNIFTIAVKNTLLFAIITGPVSYFACFFFAWIINDFGPKLRSFLTVVFYAPSLCGNAYFVWLLIFSGDRYGYANSLLLHLGLITSEINWFKDSQYIMPLLIIIQLWLSLGTGFLVFIAGLQTVDKTLYEAGAIDGIRNRWQELWHITLPAMKPQLLLGAVLQITQSFAVSDISINLCGNPSVNYAGATMVTHLIDYGSIRFEMGYASAIATLLFLIMVLSNKLVNRLLRRVAD
ncbi:MULTISPECIES: carbohydrate ABC transporter permease [Caproicibacterium]|uniref:Sugar ABC transporter permease n=1 Tax=Caproicibacterium argilliputei TaxID=3030016 RepID=A0AA97H0L2_9FIRM|nr:sugar ABC transporter permease [Caproicibacterium argilliputei]WOC31543.1 sugar ABC transporter permease [Caproicibacterium argilliputei]